MIVYLCYRITHLLFFVLLFFFSSTYRYKCSNTSEAHFPPQLKEAKLSSVVEQGGNAYIVFNDDWALVDSACGHSVWSILKFLNCHLEFLGKGFDIIGAVFTSWEKVVIVRKRDKGGAS